MCPGFDSQTWRHMWAEFVGSLLCSERFFSGNSGFVVQCHNSTNTYLVFSLGLVYQKPLSLKSSSSLIRWRAFPWCVHERDSCLVKGRLPHGMSKICQPKTVSTCLARYTKRKREPISLIDNISHFKQVQHYDEMLEEQPF